MKTIVLVKQVPETGEVKLDEETGTMIREGAASIMNPLDLYAIESALRLRVQLGGEVVVLTMGPEKAISVLKEAIAMGCDRAILLSDKRFAGADTYATSYVLSRAILKEGHFDLVICGERATDGETGQVGPGVAGLLSLPIATFVSKVLFVDDDRIQVERLIEGGYERLELLLPAVLTVIKEIGEPRLPTLAGKRAAKQCTIPVWGPEDVAADPCRIGLKGSPTRVVKIHHPRISRQGRKIMAREEMAVEEAVEELVRFLTDRNLI